MNNANQVRDSERVARQFDRSASDYADQPQPAPVLWRDDGVAHDPERCDAVLSVGEVAVLSSAGGIGKSTIALEIASAAVTAAVDQRRSGAACGLQVVGGPVYLINYEDSPIRIAHRLSWMNNGTVPTDIRLWPDPEPLWVAGKDRTTTRRFDGWSQLWRAVHGSGAGLVIIDPVSASFADVSLSETVPVRAFLRALTAMAAPDPSTHWDGCGVLLVAHDTKAARNAIARGKDPGAGVVAGSAAWYDGARGVLSLMRDSTSDDRLLQCVKANYGRTDWGARLRERTDDRGDFRGLELNRHIKRADRLNSKRSSLTHDDAGTVGVTDDEPGLIY